MRVVVRRRGLLAVVMFFVIAGFSTPESGGGAWAQTAGGSSANSGANTGTSPGTGSTSNAGTSSRPADAPTAGSGGSSAGSAVPSDGDDALIPTDPSGKPAEFGSGRTTTSIQEEPNRVKRGGSAGKSLDECMKIWDSGTHMTKAQWETTCKRLGR